MIWSYINHDELAVTSNAFFLPRQEFGRYIRSPTDFEAIVDELSYASAGFKKPASRTVDLSGWHARIKGEEVDARDPRYEKTFALIVGEIKRGNWKRKDVTTAQLKRGCLQITRLQYSTQLLKYTRPQIVRGLLNGLEACENVKSRLSCRR